MKTTLFFAFLLGLAVTTQASANDAYLLRQANELEAISNSIARELRHTGGYGYLRSDAENLAREARRFRESLGGHHDRFYIQARYNDMSNYYDRFDRRYRQTSFGHSHRHVHRSYVSITTVFHGLSGSYTTYSHSYVQPRRDHDRVIIYHAAPPARYAPFGIQHNNRRYDNDRNYRYDNRRNDHREDRGRRNHYK
ncbi:MAG: hypothetical protein Q8L60_01810 [Gammaproteobacteria bacterium]|nr:hypothetical protein [Gammaproteobacteria bacterium]MDP2142386.1 hypothetical protein [Gammaproteobacteria bacterium]MDP2348627.1 hypothetical protein [Gammaproteobacteria bacterium]